MRQIVIVSDCIEAIVRAASCCGSLTGPYWDGGWNALRLALGMDRHTHTPVDIQAALEGAAQEITAAAVPEEDSPHPQRADYCAGGSSVTFVTPGGVTVSVGQRHTGEFVCTVAFGRDSVNLALEMCVAIALHHGNEVELFLDEEVIPTHPARALLQAAKTYADKWAPEDEEHYPCHYCRTNEGASCSCV